MSKYFVLLICLILSTNLIAQDEEFEDVSVNTQFWSDFNGRYSVKEHMDVSTQIGYRTINPHIYDRYLLVPTLNIDHLKPLSFLNLEKPVINSFHLGAGLFYTNNYDGSDNNFEFRLVQGFKLFIPSFKFVPLKGYFRLEERFQKNLNTSSWDISARVRFRLSTAIEWKKHLWSFSQGLYIPASIEFFYSFEEADRYNDVIRISPGLGYKFNDDWRVELYASYHYSNNTSENQDSSNDLVLRLRLYKSSLRKKKKEIDTKEEDIKDLIE